MENDEAEVESIHQKQRMNYEYNTGCFWANFAARDYMKRIRSEAEALLKGN
jgi:hypothetical protein